MSIQYCAPLECSSCAGIGEILKSEGIQECKVCRGTGETRHQCMRPELVFLADQLEEIRSKKHDFLVPVAFSVSCSVLALALSLWVLLTR